MKIHVVSDLHLERGYQELPGGEVLVLAGDIAEARDLQGCYHSTRLSDGHPPGTMRFQDFFYVECAKYERVFYVMGNHEHYNSRFDQTPETIRACLPSNVKLMDNDAEIYNGVLFLGATLWTDCNKGDPITAWHVKQNMSDYRRIKIHNKVTNIYSKLYPEYTVAEHRKTLKFFDQQIAANPDLPVVVLTHHGPSHLSIDDMFRHDHLLNGAYVSDLSDFILNHPSIRYWFHGHIHSHKDYTVGNTRIICNPRGYIGYDSAYTGFDANRYVEI